MCYVEAAAELHWAALGLLLALLAGRLAMGVAWANTVRLCRVSVSLAEACDEFAADCDVDVAVRMRFAVQCAGVIVWGANEMFRRAPITGPSRQGCWWQAMVAAVVLSAVVLAPPVALAAAVSGIAVAAFLAVYLMWRGICKSLRPLRLPDVGKAMVYVFITPVLSCMGLTMGVLLATACSVTWYECTRAVWTLFLYVGFTWQCFYWQRKRAIARQHIPAVRWSFLRLR